MGILKQIFAGAFPVDKNLKEILKGSAAALTFRLGGMFLNYVFILIISLNFGAKALGIFALCLTALQIFTILSKIGVDVALMRFVSGFASRNDWESIKKISMAGFKLVFPISVLMAFLFYSYSGELADTVFRKPYLTKYFRIISLALVPNIIILINAERLRGLKKAGKYSFLRNMSIPLFAASILFFLMNIYTDDRLPVVTYLSAIVVTALLSIAVWVKAFRGMSLPGEEIGPRGERLREVRYSTLLKVAIPLLFTNSMVLLMGWTDTIMIGVFRTFFEVGIYRVPLRLAVAISITMISVNSILGPKITELWEKGKMDELKKVFRQSTNIIFITSLPLYAAFLLFNHQILGIFGNDFISGATALIILATGQFMNSIVGMVGFFLIVAGKQMVMQTIIFFGAIINVIMNYLLIPRYGINGAAVASLMSLLFINIIPFILIKKKFGFFTFSLKTLLQAGKSRSQ